MRVFFKQSKSALDQITNLFTFTWGTSAAIWNLRWQYNGLKNEIGDTHGEQIIKKRFTDGADIDGVNFQKFYSEMTWNDHKEELARYVLFLLFATYESWLDSLTSIFDLNSENSIECFTKGFQFLSNKKNSYSFNINMKKYIKGDSAILKTLSDSYITTNKSKEIKNIDNYEIVYRLFKEIRNKFIHGNGIADADLVTIYEKYRLLSKNDFGLKEKPMLNKIENGKRVVLDLRGIVGFSEVISRLIIHIDNRLMVNENFESIMAGYISEVIESIEKAEDRLKIKKVFSKFHFEYGFPINATEPFSIFVNTRNLI